MTFHTAFQIFGLMGYDAFIAGLWYLQHRQGGKRGE